MVRGRCEDVTKTARGRREMREWNEDNARHKNGRHKDCTRRTARRARHPHSKNTTRALHEDSWYEDCTGTLHQQRTVRARCGDDARRTTQDRRKVVLSTGYPRTVHARLDDGASRRLKVGVRSARVRATRRRCKHEAMTALQGRLKIGTRSPRGWREHDINTALELRK